MVRHALTSLRIHSVRRRYKRSSRCEPCTSHTDPDRTAGLIAGRRFLIRQRQSDDVRDYFALLYLNCRYHIGRSGSPFGGKESLAASAGNSDARRLPLLRIFASKRPHAVDCHWVLGMIDAVMAVINDVLCRKAVN